MTNMIPDSVPETCTASESVVFSAIRDAPSSDDYYCLHSVGLARHRRKEYAEADFVLIGPAGLFCIEVKGGQIERTRGVWKIGWPGRAYESTEGPFKQAQGSRWALLDFLNRRLSKNVRADALVGWGVAFPDVVFEQRDPEWDSEVIYDQRDRARAFVEYLGRLSQYFQTRCRDTGRSAPAALSRTRVAELVEALRGDFAVVPSLRGLMIDSERELVALSDAQHRILGFALNEDNPRIICEGPAGTGKTLIALEAARRLGNGGANVLFLCFNDNLNRFLRSDVTSRGDRMRVTTVHAYLSEVIRRGGYGDALRGARAEEDDRHFFERTMPDCSSALANRCWSRTSFRNTTSF